MCGSVLALLCAEQLFCSLLWRGLTAGDCTYMYGNIMYKLYIKIASCRKQKHLLSLLLIGAHLLNVQVYLCFLVGCFVASAVIVGKTA